jgi:hypothetical protein
MPGPMQFTDEQQAQMRTGRSHAELARAFGMSDMPIRRWRRNNGWARKAAVATPRELGMSPDAGLDGPSEEDMLREQVRQLKSQVRRTDKASIGDERVLRAIEDAVSRVEPVRLTSGERTIYASTRRDSSEAHHRQAAIWSDWHYGETVSKVQMNGLNEFNTAIAEDRVDQLVRSMLKFKAVRPALTGLDIWCLGDMASGAIHSLEETNEIPAAEQYVRVGWLMADAIRKLAPHYADIACAGIVGNHPRPGKEPASKDAYNNGDWIAYQIAAAATRDLGNVSWEIPPGGMLVREFAGKTFLLWHGDGVRSSMPGVPWGGIARRVNVLKDTYAAMGIRIDYVVVGHFHQRCIVPGVYMNGSLVGPNEYGIKNFGGGEAPKQLILTFDTKRSRETDVSTISFESC